jgi:hypothetical protein
MQSSFSANVVNRNEKESIDIITVFESERLEMNFYGMFYSFLGIETFATDYGIRTSKFNSK